MGMIFFTQKSQIGLWVKIVIVQKKVLCSIYSFINYYVCVPITITLAKKVLLLLRVCRAKSGRETFNLKFFCVRTVQKKENG